MLFLSPSAFWMSHSMPASAQAASRNGRSNVSQRTDDSESGRMTPTLPSALDPLSSEPVPPSLSESSPHAASDIATPNAPTIIKLNFRLTRTASCYLRLRPLGEGTQFVARHNI